MEPQDTMGVKDVEYESTTGERKVYYELATGNVFLERSLAPGAQTTSITNIPDDFHDLIPIMRYYYETDCLFGTVVDVLVKFSIDNTIQNVTDDDKVKQFFDGIVETSNLKSVTRWGMLEYYLLSNGWPYRSNTGEKVTARSGQEVPLYEWTVLNPEYTHVVGSLLFNRYKVVVKPNSELVELVEEIDEKDLKEFLPQEFIKAIKNGDDIPLDDDAVYHIAHNRQPFQRYAPVSFRRLIRPLRIKEKYMEMDLATADGLINQIIVFKLGNDQFPILTNEPLKRFAQLLEKPSKAYQLIWNHALQVEHIRPDPQALDPAKYGPINQELMYGFATPSALIGGETKGYSKDWIAVKGLVERLRWGRQDMEQWLEREYRLIAEENGLKTWPKPKLGKVNLEEERTFKQILMSLYQHGVLSGQTLLDETGYEFLTEVERLKIERDIREKDGILIPSSSYQKSKNDPDSVGVPPVTSPGRPDGTPDSEDRDARDPNPKPSGSGRLSTARIDTEYEDRARTEYLDALNALYNSMGQTLLDVIHKFTGDRRKDVVAAILLAFRDEMSSIGTWAISNIYTHQYMLYSPLHRDKDVFISGLDRVIEWNDGYVDKLHSDLQMMIGECLDRESVDEIEIFIDGILDNEEYRLAHFAREGMRKGAFAGDVSAHKEVGHEIGIWNCVFRNSCDECIERHGQSYLLDELFEIYPAHNRCQCFITYGGVQHVI